MTSRSLPKSHPLATVKPTSIRETKPPLTIVSEDPINPQDNGGIWAFPGKFILSSSQLKTLNGLKTSMIKTIGFRSRRVRARH
jgi:hypothetical protein